MSCITLEQEEYSKIDSDKHVHKRSIVKVRVERFKNKEKKLTNHGNSNPQYLNHRTNQKNWLRQLWKNTGFPSEKNLGSPGVIQENTSCEWRRSPPGETPMDLHLQVGRPGHSPRGMTENDSSSTQQRNKSLNKKRLKQQRHRKNKKETQKQIKKQKRNSREKYDCKHNQKANERRRDKRRLWREFKSKELSHRANKIGTQLFKKKIQKIKLKAHTTKETLKEQESKPEHKQHKQNKTNKLSFINKTYNKNMINDRTQKWYKLNERRLRKEFKEHLNINKTSTAKQKYSKAPLPSKANAKTVYRDS